MYLDLIVNILQNMSITFVLVLLTHNKWELKKKMNKQKKDKMQEAKRASYIIT